MLNDCVTEYNIKMLVRKRQVARIADPGIDLGVGMLNLLDMLGKDIDRGYVAPNTRSLDE
jgi:hypothetical protein